MSSYPPAITHVGYRHRAGDPPVQEYDSVEDWIQSLPALTVFELGFETGGTALVTVGTIIEGGRLEEIAQRIRIQQRLAALGH